MRKTIVDEKQDSALNVIIVLDHSGSMRDIRRSTISAFNVFLAKQRKEVGADTTFFSLYLFADTVERIRSNIPGNRVPDLSRENYRPDGQTSLLDAIGIAVRDTERRLQDRLQDDEVLVVCLTDGQENASHIYEFTSVRHLVRQKIEENWEFLWLGSNDRSRQFAINLGIPEDNIEIFKVNDAGIRESCDKISQSVSRKKQFKDTTGWKDLPPRRNTE